MLTNQARYLLTIILHKNHQIYVGTWYETCSSAHVSEMVIVPHHGQPGGFHCPACVYLLRSPSAATRGKMGITCALSASNLAKYPKTRAGSRLPCRGWHTQHHTSAYHTFASTSQPPLSRKHVRFKPTPSFTIAMPTASDFTFSSTSAMAKCGTVPAADPLVATLVTSFSTKSGAQGRESHKETGAPYLLRQIQGG